MPATAGAHRVFLDRAQPRRRLARIDDRRLRVSDRVDDRPRHRSDAAHPAHEVQRRTLGRQQAARRACEAGDDVARRDDAAVGFLDVERDRGVDQREGETREIEPGDHTRLARADGEARTRVGGHDRVGGEVAGAAEVLAQCRGHEWLEQDAGQRREHRDHAATRAVA